MNIKNFSVFTLILIFLLFACTDGLSKNDMEKTSEEYLIEPFNEVKIDSDLFQLEVISNTDLEEGKQLSFTTYLKYIGDEIVKFNGGQNTVILYITDLNGKEMHNIGYTDLEMEKMIRPGKVFEKDFIFDGLEAGDYYLFIESCAISINGEYISGYGYQDLIKRKKITSQKIIDVFESKLVVDEHEITIGSKR